MASLIELKSWWQTRSLTSYRVRDAAAILSFSPSIDYKAIYYRNINVNQINRKIISASTFNKLFEHWLAYLSHILICFLYQLSQFEPIISFKSYFHCFSWPCLHFQDLIYFLAFYSLPTTSSQSNVSIFLLNYFSQCFKLAVFSELFCLLLGNRIPFIL